MSQIAATVPAAPAPQANGGGLVGIPPDIFNGNQDHSKEFMRSFIRWWKLNTEKLVFSQPYKHVALCLSYIQGHNVEDWTDDQQSKLDDNIANGRRVESKQHWTDFKAAFDTTYADLSKKVKAKNTIHTLKMECGDLDTYIATFKKLLTLSGY
jgi:hypothetical protein